MEVTESFLLLYMILRCQAWSPVGIFDALVFKKDILKSGRKIRGVIKNQKKNSYTDFKTLKCMSCSQKKRCGGVGKSGHYCFSLPQAW